ncbi:MAG: electron transfer flavoprotein-ubiquinone oxidoreductase [Hyphomonadaceae bacterium]|nr:electron transfer flavoprotein-ubiquinone oxidoreductase [Hyphomonadaceae bacterium]
MAGEEIERESMEYDVLIIGAGPAGLAAAIQIKRRAAQAGVDVSVAVLEKGSEVGAHILSGAVIDISGVARLFPDWKARGAPIETPVTEDKFLMLGPAGSLQLPNWAMPPLMSNHGAYIVSLSNVVRWLGREAEAVGVEIYPGFAAAAVVYDESGAVKGVQVGDMGIGKNGEAKGDFTPGIELHAKYTLFAEGARGSLSKQVIRRFKLDEGREPQKYGIGIKELWEVPAENHRPGLVQHTFGWPLTDDVGGGSWMYHFGDRLVSVGFVVHLNYKNPWISPFDEFQRFKTHPEIRPYLEGGKRVGYGARAITEGGAQSVPKLAFNGGALVGCAAGFLNVPRIKGSHNAIKTGMLAADAAFDAVASGRMRDTLVAYEESYAASDVARDLRAVRNVKPLWSKFGLLLGVPLGALDMWTNTLFGGLSFFGTLKHGKTDAASTMPADKFKPITYPKADGVLTFDKLSSVFLSNTNHEEDQPAHLKVLNPALQRESELAVYGGPSTRYCPAGVYEWLDDAGAPGGKRFQINAQNCVHCKTCDIKDPNQNINWTVPEGGGGPNYPNM